MLKTYLFGLSFLLIVADVVPCMPDYSFDFEVGGWFKLHTTPETWEEAFLKCHNDGAVLASPLNKKLADALQSQIRDKKEDENFKIFLGIHDLFCKGRFTSVEGVPLSDIEISWGSRGGGADTGDCLTMAVDGRVYNSTCKESLPFICYRKLHTMNECGTFDGEYHLNQQTGSCYKVHLEEQSWTNAFGICASEGGHLVILNNEEEALIVKDMFPDNKSKQFHIGLVAWGNQRIWTSIHGERIRDVFNHWHTNQPDNYAGNQDRATYLRNGYLDDVQQWTTAMFVCEKSPETKWFQPPCMPRVGCKCKYTLTLIVECKCNC